VISDFADTGETLFVNARSAVDWNLSSHRRVHPSVGTFQTTGPRAIRVTYRWEVQDRLPQNYQCFVHICSNNVILAQQDHSISPPTSQWQIGQILNDGPWNFTLPGNLPDGDYDWLIGLFDVSNGRRVSLQGVDDGSTRIRLGVLRLANAGQTLTFLAETNTPAFDPTKWYGLHLNDSNQVVDFGDVRTDGSAWLHRENGYWSLKTWPRERNFTLEFNAQRFPKPVNVQSIGGTSTTIAPILDGTRWRLPLNGASEYRWTNALPRVSITRTNESLTVFWPAADEDFHLWASADLQPSQWSAVSNPVVNAQGLLSVTLPITAAHQFYQLGRP
jgi:hypothetical protein